MADNVTANPGAGGSTFASDDIGGVQYPRTKVTLGADGVDDGDVAAGNPLPVKVADGGDVALGATTDAAVTSDTTGTVSGKLRGLAKILASVWDSINGRLKVDGSGVTQPVSGTFFQGTQPVSAAILPLPTGAATDAGLASIFARQADGTQHAIIDSSALPTGASTSVLQTQPGVDIGDVTVNNGAGAAAVNIQDGGNSITIDGSVTSNAGTNLNTSLLALEAGGNLATLAGKDFATQTTLALVAKDATLTGGTAKEQIWDPNFAQSAMVDTLRGLRSSNLVRVMGDSFADGIGNGLDKGAFPNIVSTNDTATGGVASGQLFFRTGSAGSSAGASLQSTNIFTHVSGAVAGVQSGIQFPTTPTTWKIVARKAGVDSPVTSFNGTANTPDGNFHRYEIWYQGAGSAKFIVDGVLLHSLSGQPSIVRTLTLDLFIRYELQNDATNTVARFGVFDSQNGYFFEAVYPVADLMMNVRAVSALRLGPQQDDTGYPVQLPANAAQEAGGNLEKLLGHFLSQQISVLNDIRTELRISNVILSQGLNVQDETDRMRGDPYYLQ